MANLLDYLSELKVSEHICIVSNTNQQQEIISFFEKRDAWIEDFTVPFHERLTVREQLKFYMKWFNSKDNIDFVLKQFELFEFQNIKVKKLDYDEYVLLKVALAFLQDKEIVLFKNILHDIKIETIDCLLSIIPLFYEKHKVLQILSYIDHAILLSNEVYQVKKEQIKQLEIYTDEYETKESLPKVIQEKHNQNNKIQNSGYLENKAEHISQEINQQLTRSNVFRISVKSEDKTIFINPENIDYIEGSEGKVNIYLNNESFKADYTLNELEEKLRVYGFYRCHRSYILNLQRVTEMITWSKNSYSIKIDGLDNTFVPLSRNKVKEIQGYFNNHEVHFTEN
ncbi:LytTR family DNA-binding domain-containing protein [Macrococcus sp. EM39E]|uniref:LytTR family DNA-binding domain-containing protein n=1 Tax=Macrococcus animalis TaxID=3395467 RepID=UPI0039BDF430